MHSYLYHIHCALYVTPLRLICHVLSCTVPCWTVPSCTPLHYTTLRYSMLQYTALLYTTLSYYINTLSTDSVVPHAVHTRLWCDVLHWYMTVWHSAWFSSDLNILCSIIEYAAPLRSTVYHNCKASFAMVTRLSSIVPWSCYMPVLRSMKHKLSTWPDHTRLHYTWLH
jgi:hypothetical protein